MGQISVAHNFGMLCIRNLGTDFNLQTFQNMFDLQTLKLVELCARLSEVKSLSRVRLFATSWTVAYQAPPSMGFSRQECWSGLPFSSPGDLPDPGIEPGSPALQADALPSEPPGKSQNKIRVSNFPTIIQHSSGSPSYSNQRRKRNKNNPRIEKK